MICMTCSRTTDTSFHALLALKGLFPTSMASVYKSNWRHLWGAAGTIDSLASSNDEGAQWRADGKFSRNGLDGRCKEIMAPACIPWSVALRAGIGDFDVGCGREKSHYILRLHAGSSWVWRLSGEECLGDDFYGQGYVLRPHLCIGID